ncbi:MAG: hypothetical protein A2Y62_10565 [Candidatus Fischerbacteria bacterium RBG_13_37_8]|uniref:Uncharacterized protein n=1 Tax=Candidatus Fischerbacteria bacterium RBG_13_37_8 TaxID=1817863 RepID=A0A1F5VTU1_9BACT|nr:MAG: hypothetical protein A2Y62_10565 [Candidatus Fischerbacteria bacterium RBG_13_37_8]
MIKDASIDQQDCLKFYFGLKFKKYYSKHSADLLDVPWVRLYGTTDKSEEAIDIKNTSDGGYVLASNDVIEHAAWAAKIDTQGNLLWHRYYSSYEPYSGIDAIRSSL